MNQSAGSPPKAGGHTPGGRKFRLTPGGYKLEQNQLKLGLVDLSKTPSGIFFWRVYPGSEMAGQNRKIVTWHGDL